MKLSYTPRILIFLAGLGWFLLGLFLLVKGMHLVLSSTTSIASGACSLLYALGSYLPNVQEATTLLFTLIFLVGFCKGRYLLSKTATKHIAYLVTLPSPTSIRAIYTKKTYFIMLLMCCMGITLRLSPLAADTRGTLCSIIGFALMQGAMTYFRATANYRYLFCNLSEAPDAKKP